MAADVYMPDTGVNLPLVVYAHGFNGFKDWGNFSRIARPFTEAGLALLAFNFSHNGTTLETPWDFTDLDAFGNNNYSKQLYDIGCVLDWICSEGIQRFPLIDTDAISLIGHSMGGGVAILKAATDARIKKLIGWASISHCHTPWGKWTQQKMEAWKNDGVAYYENKRTHQQLPLYYQLYEDYIKHADALDILAAAGRLNKPFLICHGLQDPAVPVEAAYLLKMAQPNAELFITDGDHVFDRRHPAEDTFLPAAMERVVHRTVTFIKGSNP
jgi:dienelactone hydrolase